MSRAADRKYGRRKSGAYGRPSQGTRQKRANKAVRKQAVESLRQELLLARLMRKDPTHIIVIDTFGCGHARAYNTWVDANGQSRCLACKRKKR